MCAGDMVRRVLRLMLPGGGKRGSPKRRFMNVVGKDMHGFVVTEADDMKGNR